MRILKNIFLPLIFFFTCSNLYANSIKIVFTTEIEPVCGLEILKSNGSINFSDTKAIDEAEFLIRTNNDNKTAKVKFTSIVKSKNIINENGYFRVNNNENFYWNNKRELAAEDESIQKVSANIDKPSNEIEAGEASVSTVVEITCE